MSESTDQKNTATQADENEASATQRTWPRRRIAVTATLLGLLAFLFYAAEIAAVAFGLASH